MTLSSADALLLDVFDLHEHDRIVTFLTAEHGKKRGVARGARRKHSRFGGQLQPLARSRVVWFERSGAELVRIRSADLVRAASSLQGDLEGLLLGSYLADHMLEFAQENEASEGLFRLLDSTLQALAAGVDRHLATRYYEAWVLRLAGVLPAAGECLECGRDLAGGARLATGGEGLLCERCGGGLRLGAAEISFLRRMRHENLEQMRHDPPPAGTLDRIAELTARVRRDFLQHELRSHQVVRETLSGRPPGFPPG